VAGPAVTGSEEAARAAQLAACKKNPKRLRYSSRSYARQDAKRILRESRRRLRPYECACGWWHLTSQPPRDQGKAAA